MKQQKFGLGAALLALFALPASAMDLAGKTEVYGKVGVNGVRAGVGYGINEQFTVRSDFNTMGFSKKFDEDDVRYKGKLKNHKINFYGDYFPAGNGFRVTAGLGMGKSELTATGEARNLSKATFKLGDKDYTVTLDGKDKVHASVKYPAVAPYLGIGWGHNIAQTQSGSWNFNADLGLSLGTPKTKVDLNGSLNDKLVAAEGGANISDEQKAQAQAEVNKHIAAEQKKFKDNAGKLKVLPALSVGVSYRF